MRARVSVLSFVILACIPAVALSVEKGSEQVLPFYGSFAYSVPIDVPPFRGLEPHLALSYSSEGRNGFAGVGWSLSGISVIERASPSRGTPNYNSSDIYLLDGQELYPCQGGSVSPSCTSGGSGAKYSTKVESYLRIRFDSGTNTWTVTSKNGSRTVFTPVYTTTSGTLRWGQAATIDTRDNTVSYSWQFSNGDAYPYEISYGPYRVTFFRETRPDVISFATGPAMGRTRDRLRSVIVWLPGASNIRGYQLYYDPSAVSGQSLLIAVQTYGKDLIHSAGSITSGSSLPAQIFTYRTDPAAKSFQDFTPPPTRSVTTENVAWAFRTNTIEAGSGSSLQKVNGISTAWDAGGSSTRAMTSGNGYVEATSSEPNTYGKRWGLSRDDPSVDPNEIDFAFEEGYGNALRIYENGALKGSFTRAVGDTLRIEVSERIVYYKKNGSVLYQSTQVPVYPLRVDASIYQMLTTIQNVVLSGQLEDVAYWCWGNTLLTGDFNGDGRTDEACVSNAVATTRVKLSTGNGFAQPTVWYSGPVNLPFTGDFNGDGKTDLVSHDSWTGAYSVALANSTGTGFGPLTLWGTAAVGGVACNHNYSITWAGDFDGDGVLDIACRYAASGDPGADSSVLVGRSTGSSFNFSIWTNQGCDAPAYERTGAMDLNGDGKDDYFCISSHGYFYYYPSTGSGFAPAAGYLDNSFCGSSPDYVFGDFNSDGRTDVHCKLNGKVALSAGSTYVVQGSYGGWCAGTGESTNAFAADVDGDGASELVCNNVGTDVWDIQVRKWADGNLAAAETWRASWCEGAVQAGDFNGDGKTDLHCDDLATPVAVAGTYAVKADLMTAARNEIGGTIWATYTVASNFVNQTPATKQVVASVTRDDGRGGTSTKTYSYSGAYFDTKERRFLGFQYARENKPCITGETSCPYIETWFVQDPKRGSKPQKMAAKDGAGKFYRTSTFTYATNGATVPYTWLLTDGFHHTYEGATTDCIGPCPQAKRVRISHGYDAYGNENLTTRFGDEDTPGDETTTFREYAPNTADYIVGLVAQETDYSGIGIQGTRLRQARYHYDGHHSSWNVPPTDGYLTRTARWLDTTGAYVNRDRSYDSPWGNLTQDKDETGVGTNFTYDSTYHLFVSSKYVIPAETTSYLWDPVCAQPSQETNPNSQITTMTYDAFCRAWQTNGPLGSFQITTYPSFGDPANQNVLVETPSPDPSDGTGNYRQRRYFDGLGRTYKTARKPPVGAPAIYAETALTPRGSVASQTAPYHYGDATQTTTYSYDAMDRRTETRFPDGVTASTAYGLWEETRTDPEGHEDVWTYDAYGRVVSKEPESHLTTLQYDLLGNMVVMTDPGDNDWSWEYDSLGRMTEQHDPDSGLTTFQYDDAGRLRFKTDAKSQQTQLTYSTTTGRLMTKSNAAGTVQYAYSESRPTYFNVGQLTTVSDPASVQRMDYDALGRNVHSARVLDGVTYDLSRTYDSGGRLRGVTWPDTDSIGPLVYDAANRIKTMPGVFTGVQYDASDRPTLRPNANGTTTTWSYDPARGWLDSITTSGPTGTIQDLHYTHNDDGLVDQVTSPFQDEGWSYGYDAWHRLDSATNLSTPGNNQSFQYDAAGNITYNSLLGSYLYQDPNHAHAPSSVAGQGYSYDLNGSLLSGGGRTLTWNANNLPTAITWGGNSTSFSYDGLGSRVKKVSGANTTRYPFDDDFEIKNGEITKYISVPGMGVVQKRVGGSFIPYWMHTDGLGSIQTISDAAGTPVPRRTYRPYGDKISDGMGTGESRGYIDQRQDPETNLTYLHARYYDPRLAVFASPDPMGPAGGLAYAYSVGNPTNGSDRSGLMMNPLCGTPYGEGGECNGGGGIGGGISFIPGGGIAFYNGTGNQELDEFAGIGGGYQPTGNPALDENNRLESRMENSGSLTWVFLDGSRITLSMNADGYGNLSINGRIDPPVYTPIRGPQVASNGQAESGLGVGATFGGTAEAGMGRGAGVTGSMAMMAFSGGGRNGSGGVLFTGGTYGGGPPSTGFVIGSYAGFGGGVVFTNGGNRPALQDEFNTGHVNFGLGFLSFSVELSLEPGPSPRFGVTSITVGPGIGLSCGGLPTFTVPWP